MPESCQCLRGMRRFQCGKAAPGYLRVCGAWGASAAAARFDCDERARCQMLLSSVKKRSLCRLAHAALARTISTPRVFFRATTPILTAKESFRHPSPHECAERCWRLPKHL
jgi:hypothetical protein